MNTYQFEELTIGLEESFQREITSQMLREFLDITGDVNPLHNEESFALEQGYEGRVVYGMLTASMISTLGGVYLPGRYCLIHGVELDFAKPVYIGDILTVTGTVVELHEAVRRATIKVRIRNQNGKTVCKGKLKVGCLHE